MANPFLMADDDLSPQSNDLNSNPFLMQNDEGGADDENDAGDNPFLAQASNPFADFGGGNAGVDDLVATTLASEMAGYPAAVDCAPNMFIETGAGAKTTNIDSAMSFFGTTITDHEEIDEAHNFAKPTAIHINKDMLEDTMAYSDDELRDIHPPTRPVPPSRTTQDLILSVSDQMDQASTHLLDRIPVTRTPSPVSMRDLHSPSPTPEFADLLDVSDAPPLDAFINPSQPDSASFVLSDDNPFAMDAEPDMEKPAKIEPPRPPPPRPTPHRPPPPRRPSPPQVGTSPVSNQTPVAPPPRPAPPHQEPDLFDMFGADIPAQPIKPPAPKSNQDILNLFSAPVATHSAPPTSTTDLICGDILSMDDDSNFGGALPLSQMASAQSSSIASHTEQSGEEPHFDATVTAMAEEKTTTESSDNEAVENVSSISPVISDIQSTAEASPPVEKENILDEVDVLSAEHSLVGSMTPQSADHLPHISAAPPSDMSDEQMDTTVDFSGITPTPSVNPFASLEDEDDAIVIVPASVVPVFVADPIPMPAAVQKSSDEFDAFAAKFDSVRKDDGNLLDGFGPPSRSVSAEFAWGDEGSSAPSGVGITDGFGGDDEGFDSFLAMGPPAVERADSRDSDENVKEFNVVIRPRDGDLALGLSTPILAPPPRSSQNNSIYSGDSSPRINPFDKGDELAAVVAPTTFPDELPAVVPGQFERTDSQETPPTPLFDEDISQPLEDFPRITYIGDGWEMQLRQPNKKKITGQRFWKKIWLRVISINDNPVVQLRNSPNDKEPFQELPLQACYSVSDISAQQFDQFGKIFTLKLQYIFYKERPGVRPGQVTKAGRLTDKLSQFAAYAIQGDYQGVKEFGSDLKKLGLPVEHAPQVSQLFKIGSHNYEDLKQFMVYVDELLFKFNVHRDRALTYKMEEVQVTAVDELYVEQDAEGRVLKQICRVRLFFLGFLSGMPTIELGVNDLWRQGKEVVGRHDIIPVVTEEWIRLEGVEFHACVQQEEYERSRTIRFQPPDACYIELMRFRVRPPKNRELPFQLKAVWCVTGNKVELRADVLVPGFASRKLGQIPCEGVSIRFPIPECWIYLFRVEKHFRYGSVKSAHRRTGKIKGIERILGTVDQLQESLIEVTSGQAKYEHHHRAIVWRCPRLPKEGQGAYTTHQLVVRMALTSYDQIPDQLAPFCYVEFTMPATQVSHMTVRSVSVQDSDSDDPPEKYVRYLARHEYKVGIEHTTGESLNPYLAATSVARKPDPIKEEAPSVPQPALAGSDSDSDSN